MKSSDPYETRRFNLPLALTIGAMITVGITSTILGLVFWPEPKEHHDTSLEGWPHGRPDTPGAPTPGAPTPGAPTPATPPPVIHAAPPTPAAPSTPQAHGARDAGAAEAGELAPLPREPL